VAAQYSCGDPGDKDIRTSAQRSLESAMKPDPQAPGTSVDQEVCVSEFRVLNICANFLVSRDEG
jgi:hypothetical protein